MEQIYHNGTRKLVKDTMDAQSIVLVLFRMLKRKDKLATYLRLDRVSREKGNNR